MVDRVFCFSFTDRVASHADGLKGLSRVPAPQTSAETSAGVKFLTHCSQISAGAHVIGVPIGAVVVKVLTS